MNNRLRVILIPILLVLSTGAVRAEKWYRVEDQNFRVFTNSSEKRARELLLNLEQFRIIIGQLVGQDRDLAVPIDVFLFKDKTSFKPFWPIVAGHKVEVGGYFFHAGFGKAHITMQRSSAGDETIRTIFHEYTHYLTREYDWPLWLQEGVAEFYSTFRARGDEITLGIALADHVRFLRAHTHFPVEDLVAMDQAAVGYRDDRRTGMFYAQSWALFHLLRLGGDPDLNQSFLSYVARLRSGLDPVASFSSVFGASDLGARLRSYVQQSAMYISKFKMDNKSVEKAVRSQRSPEAEALVRLADLMAGSRRDEEAAQLLSRAEALDPDVTGVDEVRGLQALTRQQWEQAATHLRRAVERSPDSFLAHFYLAWAVRNGSAAVGPTGSETLTEIIGHLKRAVSLRPSFGDGYRWLAEYGLYSHDMLDEGVEYALQGLRLDSTNHELAVLLARLEVARDNIPGANEILKRLLEVGVSPGLREEILVMQTTLNRPVTVDARRDQDDLQALPSGPPPLRKTAERSFDRSNIQGPPRPAETSSPMRVPQCWPGWIDVRSSPSAPGILEEIRCGESEFTYVVRSGQAVLLLKAPFSVTVIFSCARPIESLQCGPYSENVIAYYSIGDDGALSPLAIEIKE